MRLVAWTCAALILGGAQILRGDTEVVTLTDGSFDESIEKAGSLVEFYAPWCGHCKELQPVWEKVAQTIKTEGLYEIKVAKVDCTTNPQTCKSQQVKGYPTIKYFDGANFRSFDKASRSFEAIMEFVREGTVYGIPVSTLEIMDTKARRDLWNVQASRSKSNNDAKGTSAPNSNVFVMIAAYFWNQHAVLMGVILVLAGFLAGIIFGVWFALRESTKEFHIHQQ